MKNLLSEFPSVSRAEWLEKIGKDLKGKSISDFDWQVAPGLSVGAFPHLDDLGGQLPQPIAEGETFTMDNIWVKRPGTGPILAEHFESILGKKATRSIDADLFIDWTDVA